MADTVNMIVSNVPPDLKNLLVGEARHRDVSINNHAASILCAAFGVEHVPTGVPFRPERGSTRMMFAVPAELRQKIRVKAAQEGSTMRAIIINALADHFGFDVADAA